MERKKNHSMIHTQTQAEKNWSWKRKEEPIKGNFTKRKNIPTCIRGVWPKKERGWEKITSFKVTLTCYRYAYIYRDRLFPVIRKWLCQLWLGKFNGWLRLGCIPTCIQFTPWQVLICQTWITAYSRWTRKPSSLHLNLQLNCMHHIMIIWQMWLQAQVAAIEQKKQAIINARIKESLSANSAMKKKQELAEQAENRLNNMTDKVDLDRLKLLEPLKWMAKNSQVVYSHQTSWCCKR